jgi:hypothetical protein
MENIRFVVAPYALFDTLRAFENDKSSGHYLKYAVTMEDGELVVCAEKKYHPVSIPAQESACGSIPKYTK